MQCEESHLSTQSLPKPQVKAQKSPVRVQKKPQSFLSGLLGGIKGGTVMPVTKQLNTDAAQSFLKMLSPTRSNLPFTVNYLAKLAITDAPANTSYRHPAGPPGDRNSKPRGETSRHISVATLRSNSFNTGLPYDSVANRDCMPTPTHEPPRQTRIPRLVDSCRLGRANPSPHNNGRSRNAANSRGSDSYVASPTKQQRPELLQNRLEYMTCSLQQLLREVSMRHLNYKHAEATHLVQILMIDDKVFFERCKEMKHFTVDKLLQQARSDNLPIHTDRRWELRPPLTRIAEMLAQTAVAQHNDQLQVTNTDVKVKTRAVSIEGDRAVKGRHPITATEDAAAVEKSSKSHPTNKDTMKNCSDRQPTKVVKKIVDSKEKVGPSMTKRNKTEGIASQNSRSKHVKGKSKATELPVVFNKKQVEDSSTERHTRSSHQVSRASLTEKIRLPHSKSNKRIRSAQDEVLEGKPAKRSNSVPENRATSQDDAHDAEHPSNSAIEHGEEMDIEPEISLPEIRHEEQGKAENLVQQDLGKGFNRKTVQATMEADDATASHDDLSRSNTTSSSGREASESQTSDIPSPAEKGPASTRKMIKQHVSVSRKIPAASSSEDDIPSPARKKFNKRKFRGSEEEHEIAEQVSLKKAKIRSKRKLMGIPAEERVAGMPYTKTRDGLWKLKERFKKVGVAGKFKSKPNHNFIKD
jgi:hypothetical protein